MINTPTLTPSGVMNASAVLGFRFDTIMTTLAANTRIHLGPTSANRPFLTKGYKVEGALGLSVKPAMKIIGSGIDVTTLCLVGQPGTCYAIGHDFAAGTVDYFEVSDLTIDSNLMIPVATGNTACGAVRVMGNHARVRRIKVINWGANAAVPLFVVQNNLVELVLNIHPNGYGSPVGILVYPQADSTPQYLCHQAVIRGNVVRHVNNTSDPSQRPVGIELWLCANALVENNVINLDTSAPIRQYGGGTLKYFNTQTPAGKLLQAYDFTLNQYLNELTTDGELALLSSS